MSAFSAHLRDVLDHCHVPIRPHRVDLVLSMLGHALRIPELRIDGIVGNTCDLHEHFGSEPSLGYSIQLLRASGNCVVAVNIRISSRAMPCLLSSCLSLANTSTSPCLLHHSAVTAVQRAKKTRCYRSE